MYLFEAHFRHFFFTIQTSWQPLLNSPALVCSLALLSPFIFLRAASLYLPIDLLCSINMLECQLESPSCPSVKRELQHFSKSFPSWLCQPADAQVCEDEEGNNLLKINVCLPPMCPCLYFLCFLYNTDWIVKCLCLTCDISHVKCLEVKGLVCKTISSSSKTTHQVKCICKGRLVEGHFFSVKRYSVCSIVALCKPSICSSF